MGGLTGGTVPAKIWHDIMLVATEKYGNKDFDYPAINLEGYSGVTIGEEEKPEEENSEGEENSESNVENKAPEIDLKPTTPAEVVKNFKTQNQTQNAPSGLDKAPIPMAVPESLR